jgi:hypothetical protein
MLRTDIHRFRATLRGQVVGEFSAAAHRHETVSATSALSVARKIGTQNTHAAFIGPDVLKETI